MIKSGKLFFLSGIFLLTISALPGNGGAEDTAPTKTDPGLKYLPGEVLVKFREGANPDQVLKETGLSATSIERQHSIKPVVAKFKKSCELKKESNGWYSFLGKNYNSLDNIPDETVFKQAYAAMSEQRKGLYRKYKIELSKDISVEEAVSALKNDPNVEAAYPNYIRRVNFTPNDAKYGEQWALPKINAPAAWDLTFGDPGIVIAIIDTGIDYNHPDLAANIWMNTDEISDNGIDDDGNGYVDDYMGYDFVTVDSNYVDVGEDPGPPDNDPMDFYGHGSHCAGIAAGVIDNGIGIAGIAPHVKIMNLRAGFSFGGYGSLIDSDIEDAVLYAIDNGANIISMSFGSDEPGIFMDELELAASDGVLLFASAGNSYDDTVNYPAAMDEVIAVAATNGTDDRADFSTYGTWVDCAAPGVHIVSTLPGNNYGYMSGTSMACPYAAGVGALILSRNPLMTAQEARLYLEASCDDIGPAGKDIYTGNGRINAYHAALIVGTADIEITQPVERTFVHGIVDIQGTAYWESIFTHYKLFYQSLSGGEITGITGVMETPVKDGTLGQWDSSGVPDGDYSIILRMYYSETNYLTRGVQVSVDNTNDPPVIYTKDQTAIIGRPFSFTIEAKDSDDPETPHGQLHYNALGLPEGATVNSDTGLVEWQPAIETAGTYNITLVAMDDQNTVTKPIMLTTLAVTETLIRQMSSPDESPTTISTPSIKDGKISWVERGPPPDLTSPVSQNAYVYDMATGQTTKLTNYTTENSMTCGSVYRTQISGDTVAWLGGDTWDGKVHPVWFDLKTMTQHETLSPLSLAFCFYGDNFGLLKKITARNYSICRYNIATGAVEELTTRESSKFQPIMDEEKIVWIDRPSTENKMYIYEYDLNTGNTSMISDGSIDIDTQNAYVYTYNYPIGMYKNLIAYTKVKRSGLLMNYWENSTIWIYDKNTGQRTAVGGDDSFIRYGPRVFGNIVAYHGGYYHMVNSSYLINEEIRIYDVISGKEYTAIKAPPSDDIWEQWRSISFDIDHKDIVWSTSRVVDYVYEYKIMLTRIFLSPIIKDAPAQAGRGEIIKITGANFGYAQDTGKVVFSNNVNGTIESWSDTEILCRVPLSAETGLLKVATAGGASNAFEIEVTGSGSQAGKRELIIDFGAAYGIYTYTDSTGTWSLLHPLTARRFLAADLDGNGKSDVVIDFGAPFGILIYSDSGAWSQLHPLSAESITAADLDGNGKADIIVDFGSPWGILVYRDNGTWFQLHPLSAKTIQPADLDGNGRTDIIVDFGEAWGIFVYRDNGTWEPFHPLTAKSITAGDLDGNGRSDVIVDFGDPYGILVYRDNGTWSQFHPLTAKSVVTLDIDGNGRSDVAVDFGPAWGIFICRDNGTWECLHPLSAMRMIKADVDGNGKDELVIDFGDFWGLFVYYGDGQWKQIHPLTSNGMTAGDLDGQ